MTASRPIVWKVRAAHPLLRATILLSACSCLVGCGSSGGSVDNVPITVSSERFLVSIQIGNATPIRALLDTASSGLRVLSTAVPPSALADLTDTDVKEEFGGGLAIAGVVAHANVTVGTQTTAAAIPIMWIQSWSCVSTVPDCDASIIEADTFGEAQAILGIGMENPDNLGIGNPIVQLPGHPGFAVHASNYGTTSAVLRIGTDIASSASFDTYALSPAETAALPNGTPTWKDIGIPSCVDNESTGASYCYPGVFDTGAPTTYVFTPSQPSGVPVELAPGTQVKVTIGNTSSPIGSYTFVVGPDPTPGVDEVILEYPPFEPRINTGLSLFYRYDVLFDQEHGMQGLLAH
jgi:hypothetical protein